MKKHGRFEELPVWQKAADLYIATLDLADDAGPTFSTGFRNQLDRASLSVSNNIAEGFERYSTGELLSFLTYARGSAGEVRSMLTIISRRAQVSGLLPRINEVKDLAEDCCRQLGAWSASLRNLREKQKPEKVRKPDGAA